MATGAVKWFDLAKGFGLIRPYDGSDDVFVHINDVEQAGLHGLSEGQRLAYDIKVLKHGPMAINLKVMLTEPSNGSMRKKEVESYGLTTAAKTCSFTSATSSKQACTA